MAKLGKYSTGLGTPKTSPSPYGESNKGWEGRSALSFDNNKAVSMKKGGTATGNDVPVYDADKRGPRK